MIFTIINLLTSVLALIVFFNLLKSYADHKFFNVYFLILLLLISLPRLIYSLAELEVINSNYKNLFANAAPAGYIFCLVIFLFLRKLLQLRLFTSTSIVITIVIISTLILNFLFGIPKKTLGYLFSTTTIIAYSYNLIGAYLQFKNKELNYSKQFKIWVIGLYLMFLLIIVYFNVFFSSMPADFNDLLLDFLKGTSILWLILLSYILLNPSILNSEKKLKKALVKTSISRNSNWSIKPLLSIEEKDDELSRIIKPQLELYFYNLEKINFVQKKFTTSKPIDFISNKLKIPKSHTKFLFKYHCYLAPNAFLNYFRIKYAIKRIENDFLEYKTIDSLAKESGYNSTNPFYMNFKKFNNCTVGEYINQKLIQDD